MIQRIQSVYLAVAVIAITVMFFFPVSSFYGNEFFFSFGLMGVSDQTLVEIKVWPLQIMAGMLIGLTLVSIFLFKNRLLQTRIIRIALLLDLAFIIMIYFGYVDVIVKKAKMSAQYEAGSYFPLIAIVFLLLAMRAVLSDEKKVRSADRLR
ncbi:MAG: DUF4293 domain-containing protein [Bacteroidales bacterium]|nr:DUF4293 domain-containing protein [Bacteroidales bacterium]MDZ4204233.1 DUF4293 domain-containing protein [Bacteroidales bacterium]